MAIHSKNIALFATRTGVALFFLLLMMGVPASGQDRERLISRHPFKQEPVIVMEASVGGKPVKLDAAFERDGAWLRGFQFRVQNVTPKTIKGVSYTLIVPIKGRPRPLGVTLFHGDIPEIKMDGIPLTLIPPGGSVSIALDEETFDGLKSVVESKEPLENVKEVSLMLDGVYFTDGSYWKTGRFFTRDNQLTDH